jgi:hypothetical protein
MLNFEKMTAKTEIELGNCPSDVRTISHSLTNDPELELRLAKGYWLKTIQPHTAGRKLRGVEFYVAADAYRWLRMMAELATSWNKSEKGKTSPIPLETFPEWEKDEFREPEELVAGENLKPETLASIAAPLVEKTGREKMTAAEAVRHAHDLLMAAEQHIGTLPKQRQGTGTLPDVLKLEFCKVTFAEILQSNESTSGRLPLLPPVQQQRNAGRLRVSALKIAVKRFLQKQLSSKTKEQHQSYERHWKTLVKKGGDGKGFKPFRLGDGKPLTYREWQKQNQDSINECLENEQISFRLLTTLRYHRFKKFLERQQNRVLKRKSSEKAKSKRVTR